MKTVVDRSKSQFSKVIFNERFRQFSKDAGFYPIACRPFRPQIKGKVEGLARTMDRLKVYNYEIKDKLDFCQIVSEFMNDLNHEKYQAIKEKPVARWANEQLKLKSFNSQRYLKSPSIP